MRVTKANFWMARAVRLLTQWHFIPQTPRERLCRLLFRPGDTAHFDFIIPLNGILYEGNLGTYQDWRVFFLGSFERETINLLTHVLKAQPDAVLLDIGANRGLFTAVLARHCGRVMAFEPFPPLFRLMKRLVALNNIENVTMHMLGLGATTGAIPFYPPGGFNTGAGSFLRHHQNDRAVVPVDLPIARGDDVLAGNREPIAAIKLDTEGFEGFALAGLRGTLERYRPIVVLEMSHTTASGFSAADEFAGLFPPGYMFFMISDHTICPTWRLTPVAPAGLLSHFGNVLACPTEKRNLTSPP